MEKPLLRTVTANFSGTVSRRQFNGRDHAVVPMTLIVPGVLNGSQGALYYPPEEIARNVGDWNGMPLVVYHPKTEDGHTSARHPAVLEKQGVGTLFNVRFDGGKLKGDGWFDLERTKQVDPRVAEAIENGRPIELSTGLFTNNEPAPQGSNYNGIPYTHVARNYRPDHLAVLPDQVGACSIQDGCGVLMNSDERLSIWQRLGSILGLTDNQMSHSDLRSRLAYLLKERFGEDAYLEDVYSSTIVYELGGQTYRMKYLSDARSGKVTLIDDLPYPVMKTTTYKPARNAGKPNQSKETEMDKAQMVEFLTNSTCCWDESDQEVLNELSDEKLGLLVSNYKESEATKQVVNEATKGFEHDGVKFEFDKDELKFNAKVPDNFKKKSSSTGEEDGEDEEDMEAETKNKRKEPMTEEQWMQVAPPSVREDLAYARNQKATRKSELIGKITANVADDQKERVVNRLKDRPLDELEDLAVLAPQPKDEPIATPTANYRGLGIPTPRVDNQDDKDDFLPLPTMDFTSKN